MTRSRADYLPAPLLSVADELTREFEGQLAESATLAFRVAFSVLRHRQDAEDVAQDALVRAHRHFSRLRQRDRLRAWLVRTAWRLALDHRRGAVRRSDRETQHVVAAAVSAEQAALAAERAARLWDAIDALPEKLRLAIVLSSIEGHDVREVAALLGLAEGTVKSRLFLARQQLKEQLQWIR